MFSSMYNRLQNNIFLSCQPALKPVNDTEKRSYHNSILQRCDFVLFGNLHRIICTAFAYERFDCIYSEPLSVDFRDSN